MSDFLQTGPDRPRGNFAGRKLFGWIIFIALAILLVLLMQYHTMGSQYQSIPISDFETLLVNNQVKSIKLDGDDILGEFKTPQTIGHASVTWFKATYPAGLLKNSDYLKNNIMAKRGDAKVESAP